MVTVAGELFDEFVGHGILEKSARRGGLGPEEKIGLRGDGGGAQTLQRLINALLESRIPFFVLRDGRLHRGDFERNRWAGRTDLPQSVTEGGHDQGDGQREIEVGADASALGFEGEAFDRGHGDGRGHHGEKGNSAHAGERTQLDERDIAVQGNAEGVPSETGEDRAAQLLQGDPSRRGDGRRRKIAPRTEPDRSEAVRVLARGGRDPDDAGPDRRINGQVKAEHEPSEDSDLPEPVERTEEINEPGEVAELHLAKQGILRVDRTEPQRGQERRERDPDEPGLVERREAENKKQAAQCGGGPGPELDDLAQAEKRRCLAGRRAMKRLKRGFICRRTKRL